MASSSVEDMLRLGINRLFLIAPAATQSVGPFNVKYLRIQVVALVER